MLRGFLFCFSIFFFTIGGFSQSSMHPAVQKEVDALNFWLQSQMEVGKSIDQAELQRRNETIRALQDSLQQVQKTTSTSIPEGKHIRRSGFPGNSFRVPDHANWHIQSAYLKSMNQTYRIKLADYTFKSIYQSGEELRLPTWTAEFSLLDGSISSMQIELEIIEVPKQH